MEAAAVRCFFARFDPKERPCEGRSQKAHLIAKQTLRREFRAAREPGVRRGETIWPDALNGIWDARVWVPACERHHHLFDHHMISVPRESLPESFLSLAEELGLSWAVDRRYGPQEKL